MNRIHVLHRNADGSISGKACAWEDRELLIGEFQSANVVAVHVEHDQGGQTNVLQFSGHDAYFIKYVGAAGLMVRCYGVPEGPGNEYGKTWFLRNNGNQDTPIEMPANMVRNVGAGMDVQLMGYNWKSFDYDEVTAAARAFDLSDSVMLP